MSTFSPSAQFNIGARTYYMAAHGAVLTAPMAVDDGAIIDITDPKALQISPVPISKFFATSCNPEFRSRRKSDGLSQLPHLWITPATSYLTVSPIPKKYAEDADVINEFAGPYTVFTYPGLVNIRRGQIDQRGIDESRKLLKSEPACESTDDYLLEDMHPTAKVEFMLRLLGDESHVDRRLIKGLAYLFGYIKSEPALLRSAVEVYSRRLATARPLPDTTTIYDGFYDFYPALCYFFNIDEACTQLHYHGDRTWYNGLGQSLLEVYQSEMRFLATSTTTPAGREARKELAALSLSIVGE